MVAKRSFLIDATFFLEDAEKAFLGAAPLVDFKGRNTSVVYGAVRDMLRLRGALGIAHGTVLIGADADEVSTAANIEMFTECLRAIGAYVLHEPKLRVGALCRSILQDRKTRCIVTRNKSLMQLVGARCIVVLTSEGTVPEVVTVATLASSRSIRPDQVASLLALTDASFTDPLTTKQAVRLLEVCGTLGAALDSPGAASPTTKRYLSTNKAALLGRLQDLTILDHVGRARVVPAGLLIRNDAESRNTLKEHGFPSLGRFLASPARVDLVPNAQGRDRDHAHVAVVDRAGLRELKRVVSCADVCAVDTESTDKDPRKASLLGVALAVRAGQAFYVPVTKPDLRDVSTAEVTAALRGLLGQRVKVVGHNLKYDYVLLRRNGIQIVDPHFDTMLAAHECFGDWDFFNLGAVAKRLLGQDVKRYRDIVGEGETLQDIPFKDLVEHGCADVDATLRLYDRLRRLLKEKGINDQFAKEAMPLMRLLGDKELEGVRVNIRPIERTKRVLAGEVETAKASIFAKAGKRFDVDSIKDIATVLRAIDGLREKIGRQSLRQGQLEQLAQVNDLARAIVQYGRLQKRVRHLDAICNAEKDGKVFTLFSQVKAAHGSLSSADPKFFDSHGAVDAAAVLDKEIRQLMPDEDRALDILQRLTGDRTLEDDRRRRKGEFIGGGKSSIAGLVHSDVLLSIAIGVSNAALCKRFLIDPRRATVLREDVTARYPKMAGWLDEYRKTIISAGFASSGTRRRYWEGLRSSDLDKRNRAVRSAIRWLIGM